MESMIAAIERFLTIGNGDGDGNGYGNGYGYGYGDGNGHGSLVSVNRRKVYYIDGVPTVIDSVHGNVARGGIVLKDWTLKTCFVARVGDFFAHGHTLREAVRDAEAKALDNEPVEQRIERFKAAFPDFDKPVPCRDLFNWHHILTGSCEAGRRQFCQDHGIDMDAEYTVRHFISITRDAYGGDVIKRLED